MENKEGNKDQTYDKLLEDIGAIAQQISGMYDQAVAVYTPLVNSICSRKATSNEVEHLLDWMFGLVGDERMLLLFKRVCRAYWQTYPESIASYIMEYRKKDVLMTKVVYKPALMKQLFELGCAYSSKELSLNKMLGQLQDAGNVTTLAGYLTTLDESRLLCGLQKYASDNARKYNSVPKLMVYNTALFSVQSGMTFNKAFTTPNLWGRWVESAVGAHLLNQADEYDYRLYFWREKDDEVDFVIEFDKRLIAIEVKSGRRTSNNGLPLFGEQFHPVQSFVVGSGGIPIEEFLTWDIGRLLE